MALKTVSTLGISGGGGGTPGGANTQVQFNSSGSFGGSANLTWDGGNVQIGSSGRLKLSNGVTNYVGFNAPAIIPANVTWTLPSTDGASGNFLITNGSGTLSWAAANLTPIAPSNYSLPVVSGTTTVGQTLSSTTGGWNGYPAPTYAYQWVRGASNIANATSATYPLVDLDYNNTIKVIVIASNSAGNATANSVATATIAGTVPGAPTIGTATAGNAQASVAFTANTVTGGPNVTIYTATSNPENITGTNNVSPVIVSGLTNGNAYTFTVTATNSIGTGAASAASNSVTPSAAPVTDTYFPYVPLLLETTSTNGQQNNTFLDSSSNTFTITRNGTPTQGSITPYWPNGQWSNYFNGSTDRFALGTNAALNPGTNFTFECWIYSTGTTTNSSLFEGATGGLSVSFNGSNQLSVAQSGVGYLITDPTAFALANQWVHVAVVRSGTTLSLYKNGTRVATSAANSTSFVTATQNYIAFNGGAAYFPGYISNLRLVKGTAVYDPTLTTLTIPTSPLTAITNTSLLICQSNRFIDNASSPNTITLAGTPKVQAFQPFSPTASYTTALYGGSGYFVASTSDTLLTSSSQIIPTGNFTIEVWAYVTSSTATQVFVSQGTSGSAGRTAIGIDNSSGAKWFCQVGGVFVYSSAAPTLNTWNYLAMTYNSSTSTIALYLNGTSLGSASNTISAQNAQLRVSGLWATPVAGYYLDGYLSSVRVSNTVRTVTSVPTAPFTNDANTSLLLNFTNAGIYDAAAQNDVTTVSNAQVSIAQSKWPPTSMSFNGSTDYLRLVDSPVFDFGSSDFTIEAWVYTASTNNQIIYGRETTSLAGILFQVSSGLTVGVNLSSNGSTYSLVLTGGTISASTWTYVAVTRVGSGTNNIKLFLGTTPGGAATQVAQNTFSGSIYTTTGMTPIVGARNTNAIFPFSGYIQDLRITRGVGRTITTVPTASFPVQ